MKSKPILCDNFYIQAFASLIYKRSLSIPFSCVPCPAKIYSFGFAVQNESLANFKIQVCIIIKFKNMRKTTNLLIREGSKKSSRQNPPNPQAITNTSFKSRQSKDSKRPINSQQLQFQKQMIRAQNLTQKQQEQIHNEARKTVTKKIKMTQNKIQSQMVVMLESQCSKLGAQLQRQRIQNQRLKMEVQKLRKSIQSLNQKLEKAFNEQTHLSKHQIDGKIQNKQLAQQLQSLRNQVKKKQNQVDTLHSQKQALVSSMRSEIDELKSNVEKLNSNIKNLREQKEQIEQQLEQKTKQAQYLRQNFELKKKSWDMQKRELQTNVKSNLQKKGQKLTKYQVDMQKLQDRLKQQETMRKKIGQKNKELQKQLNEQVDIKKQLQEQITSYKKRVNDLSILKSSNNAIMNQKIAKIVQENEKLKQEIQQMKTGVKPDKSIEKPILFGASDFD